MKSILMRVYKSERATLALKLLSNGSSMLVIATFCSMLVFALLDSFVFALSIALLAGIPFVLVTVIRKLINARRPYEIYDFYENLPKLKSGNSFPSRHVFSAFIIATLAYVQSIHLTIALVVLGIAIALARVLLGIHFIRDVLVGAAFGIVFGIIGILILKGFII